MSVIYLWHLNSSRHSHTQWHHVQRIQCHILEEIHNKNVSLSSCCCKTLKILYCTFDWTEYMLHFGGSDFSVKYCAIFSLTFWVRDGISKLNLLPLCVLWSDLWSRPQSFPRCLLCRWQRGRRTSCWRWCPDTMSLGTWNQLSDRSHIRQLLRLQKVCLTYGLLLISSLGIRLTGVHWCQSITMK